MCIDYRTLNASLRDLLDNIHSYYVGSSLKYHISSDTLKDIYKTIFDYPLLKDKILWFNAWFEEDDGSLSFLFLFENHSNKATKGILEKVFSHKEFDSYVTSVRDLNSKLNKKDLSYIISNCNDIELSALEGLSSDMFLHLKFKNIIESIFNSTNFEALHNELDQKYRVNTTTGVDETIKRLREIYHTITKHHKNEIENLKQRLQAYSNEYVEDKDVAKIINHFFWIKLAYPMSWKMMIALPGVMAKAVRSVPMGVNVGLKDIIPPDVIYFLKTAVLLFFTRKSVDFFEIKATKEAEKRTRDINYLNKLLGDFQHTLLQKVMETLQWCGNEMVKMRDSEAIEDFREYYEKPFNNLCAHIRIRGEYLDKLSYFLAKRKRKGNSKRQSKRRIKKFISSGVFANSPICVEADVSFKKSLTNWRKLVRIIEREKEEWIINAYSGAIETILENLLSNSMVKHITPNEKENDVCEESELFGSIERKKGNTVIHQYRVRILLGSQDDGIRFLVYYDTGKGFEKNIVSNFQRWIVEGPSEEEHDQGYGYWLIGRILAHIGGKLKFTVYEKHGEIINTLIPRNLCINNVEVLEEFFKEDFSKEIGLENLCKGHVRLIHWFMFE